MTKGPLVRAGCAQNTSRPPFRWSRLIRYAAGDEIASGQLWLVQNFVDTSSSWLDYLFVVAYDRPLRVNFIFTSVSPTYPMCYASCNPTVKRGENGKADFRRICEYRKLHFRNISDASFHLIWSVDDLCEWSVTFVLIGWTLLMYSNKIYSIITYDECT